MEYPLYLALFFYLKDGTYPRNSIETQRRGCFHGTKFLLSGNQLFEATYDEEGNKAPGRELLHEGNANDTIRQDIQKAISVSTKNNTWKRVSTYYTRPRLFERVRALVQECTACQFRTIRQRKRYEPAHPNSAPEKPFHMVGCDAVDPIKEPGRPNQYILVAIDYLTRWPIAAVVDQIGEETKATFLFVETVMTFGVPAYILTDRGVKLQGTLCGRIP